MTQKEALAKAYARAYTYRLDIGYEDAVNCFLAGFDAASTLCAHALTPFTIKSLDESVSEFVLRLGENVV